MSSAAASTTAIVPLRTGGKTRLAGALGEEERAALAGAMLADVTRALADAGISRIVAAVEGPAARAAAGALDLEVVGDAPETPGLDGALRHAAMRVVPSHGLLVVAADLPCLTAPEVGRLLGGDAEVAVAPTRDGGTGGLLRRPVAAIPTAYGPGSAARHLRLARDGGLTTEVLRSPGFAHDVDTVDDLLDAATAAVGPATARLLHALGLPDRLAG